MVQYVSDFSFPKSPPRPTAVAGQRPSIRGYASGGHVKASTPQCYSKGGSTTPFRYKDGGLHKTSGVSNDSGHVSKSGKDSVARAGAGDKGLKYAKISDRSAGPGTRSEKKDVGGKSDKKVGSGTVVKKAKGGSIIKTPKAEGKVPQSKNSVNPGDASSPGSYVKKAPGQSGKNSAVAKDKFSAPDVAPESTGDGNKQRMAGWSDFKDGGSTKPAFNRLSNLGHYAHGGKVKASGEKPSGKAGSGKVSAPVAKSPRPKVADSTKSAPGSRVEMKSGTAKAAMGGLSRGTSPKKNAAIHAKSAHKAPKAPHGAASGALAGLAQALSAPPSQPSAPGMGPSPPGMSPGMGAPPGGAMGPRGAPPMAGGMPGGMSHGGMVIHHVMHGAN